MDDDLSMAKVAQNALEVYNRRRPAAFLTGLWIVAGVDTKRVPFGESYSGEYEMTPLFEVWLGYQGSRWITVNGEEVGCEPSEALRNLEGWTAR